jgi:hypothetical protein
MITIKEINLSNDMAEVENKVDKARTLLSDLFNEYEFTRDEPSKDEAEKIALSSRKIMTFIEIALDYVYGAKKDLEKIQDNICSTENVRAC